LALAGRIADDLQLLDAAESSAIRLLGSDNVVTGSRVFATVALARVAAHRRSEKNVARYYEELVPEQKTSVVFGLTSVDRVLGLLSQTMGNLDDSQTHFEDALAFCRRAGYRPELAWSLCDYADMLTERNEDGDKDKATAMLDESLAISTEQGMRPLLKRVLSRRKILKA